MEANVFNHSRPTILQRHFNRITLYTIHKNSNSKTALHQLRCNTIRPLNRSLRSLFPAEIICASLRLVFYARFIKHSLRSRHQEHQEHQAWSPLCLGVYWLRLCRAAHLESTCRFNTPEQDVPSTFSQQAAGICPEHSILVSAHRADSTTLHNPSRCSVGSASQSSFFIAKSIGS